MLIMAHERERRALQVVVAVLGLVPVLAGSAGIILGTHAFGGEIVSLSGDSHVRYLSGLLLAIGIAFWRTVPCIEHQGARFRLLTGLVFVGGLCRLAALAVAGIPGKMMISALCMEVIVTPLLALWRERVARTCAFARSGTPETG